MTMFNGYNLQREKSGFKGIFSHFAESSKGILHRL